MRKLKLLDYQIKTLVKLPETGMGYQKVKLTFKNGDVFHNMTVLNSEFLVVEDQIVDINEIEQLELERK